MSSIFRNSLFVATPRNALSPNANAIIYYPLVLLYGEKELEQVSTFRNGLLSKSLNFRPFCLQHSAYACVMCAHCMNSKHTREWTTLLRLLLFLSKQSDWKSGNSSIYVCNFHESFSAAWHFDYCIKLCDKFRFVWVSIFEFGTT